MRKVALALLLTLLATVWLPAPALARGRHHGHPGRFFLGVGIGVLLTAPWWGRPVYAYPAYPYPAYPYPASPYSAYPYPVAPYVGSPAPVAVPAAPPPPPPRESGRGFDEAGVSAGRADCRTVQVPGYYETHALPDGRHMTAWVPARLAEACR